MKFLDKLDQWLYKYQEEQLHFLWAFAFTTLAIWWKKCNCSSWYL